MEVGAQLREHRALWQAKPALRAVYHDCYRRMAAAARPGLSLEIGGGSGNFQGFAANVVSTDVQPADWLDAVCDAHALPFAAGSFDNVVMFDVLHHLERPPLFFAEAARVLRPGGHGIYTVPLFWPLHEEPRDFYRYTRHGLRHRFEAAGLEVVEIRALTGFWLTFGQALAYWLAGLTRTPWYNPLRWLAWPAIPLVQAGAWLLGRLERGEAFTAEYLAVVRRPAGPAGDGRSAGGVADAGAGPGP